VGLGRLALLLQIDVAAAALGRRGVRVRVGVRIEAARPCFFGRSSAPSRERLLPPADADADADEFTDLLLRRWVGL
jgi:hypothetical protein